MQIGIWQLVIILVIVMLLFGATQIPRLMRGLGQGVTEFKKGLQEGAKDEPGAKEAEKKDSDKPDAEKPAS
jgi:sec-independent protein translocase protein TatA